MSEEAIKMTVDGIDYEIEDEGGSFTIMCDDENFAEVKLSECGEYYEYDYSPMFASIDDCGGSSPTYNHEGIMEFFRWVISTNI